MNETEKILDSLIDAITFIDGGCVDCICNFIDMANDSIKKFGFEYQYNVLDKKVHLLKIV